MLSNNGVHFSAFENALQALEAAGRDPKGFDGAILDIVLNNQPLKGVDVAVKLRELGFDGGIVFLTSSNDYAAESYRSHAAGYVLKPLTAETGRAALETIKRYNDAQIAVADKQNSAAIFVKNGGEAKNIRLSTIMYVEVVRDRCTFHLTGGTFSAWSPLKELLPTLVADGRFAVCHRSFVANLHFVANISGNVATLTDGTKLPISHANAAFKRAFIEYSLGAK
jgi:DNA-binding LytR/AlgR family response regulator